MSSPSAKGTASGVSPNSFNVTSGVVSKDGTKRKRVNAKGEKRIHHTQYLITINANFVSESQEHDEQIDQIVKGRS